MKLLVQSSFILALGLFSACASSTLTTGAANETVANRNPASVDEYTAAVVGKEYPVEKISPAVLSEEEIEAKNFGYWGPFSHARSYLKEASLKKANDTQRNPASLCAPSNTAVSLPAGKTWVVTNFSVTGEPSCDISNAELHCDTPYSATCVAK